tara:strand:- start:265 stop:1524 length:1260 start_codon:yes stop_codon:yes gene_type:complete
MEKLGYMENTKGSGSISLTKHTFERLITSILKLFKHRHSLEDISENQLYGFGNYDDNLPSLKKEFEKTSNGFINGKYLYNKYRELQSGKPQIKISGYYKNVFFKYLGFNDVFDFLKYEINDKTELHEQQKLLKDETTSKTYYYVMYYYGEDKKMTKGHFTILNNWKTFELVFVYKDTNENIVTYTLFGTILQQNNFAYFETSLFTEKRKIKGANFIFYIGKSTPTERPIIIGTYSSFDKYDHCIAGKIIAQQFDSKDSMMAEAFSDYFEPYISQELVKIRFINESSLPKHTLKLSNKSPYSDVFGRIPNKYTLIFNLDDGTSTKLNIEIEKYHYNILCIENNIFIENDRLSLENKGQILEISFDVFGVFFLQKAAIFAKTFYLFQESTEESSGVFSGVDINNNLVNGSMVIQPREKVRI